MEAEEALLVCSAAIVVLGSAVPKKRGRKRRWWHTELFKKRCGNELGFHSTGNALYTSINLRHFSCDHSIIYSKMQIYKTYKYTNTSTSNK
jgi:hypothetical protein